MDNDENTTKNSKTKPLDPLAIITAQQNFLHDLATPLMVVQGMLDNLTLTISDVKKTNQDEQNQDLEKATRNFAKIVNLVRQHRKQLAEQLQEIQQ